MRNLYADAFCRDCRLHFEYAIGSVAQTEELVVLCPQCNQPAKHSPFQPCDLARFERIEAQYERLARHAEARRTAKQGKGKRRDRDDDWDPPRDRKRRKNS